MLQVLNNKIEEVSKVSWDTMQIEVYTSMGCVSLKLIEIMENKNIS